ncbi:MAG: AMP-binding protein [Treponema sp.]|nr:AMP-binding protein [Treponema sp.]
MYCAQFSDLLSDLDSRFSYRSALIEERNGWKVEVSFHELHERVRTMALQLLADPCLTVGICANPCIDWVVLAFASVLAEKRTVLIDPALSSQKIQKLIDYAHVERLYVNDALDFNTLVLNDRFSLQKKIDLSGNCSGKFVFFTSGTESPFKAVVLSQQALLNNARHWNHLLPCTEYDVLLCALPLSHIYGFEGNLLWPLMGGTSVALGRGWNSLSIDPRFFMPTVMSVVPSMLKYMLDTKSINERLRTIVVGASSCDTKTLELAKSRGVDIRSGYGLTETGGGIALSCKDEDFATLALCPDTTVRIGEDGEIFVRTSSMMDGYLVDNVVSPEALFDGEFATGDLGFVDENGRLHLQGRKKDLLVLDNGEKIPCLEWEEALTNLLHAETAVVLRDGKPFAIVFSSMLDKVAAWKEIEAFNAVQGKNQQIAALELRSTPLPRTELGKLQRWLL